MLVNNQIKIRRRLKSQVDSNESLTQESIWFLCSAFVFINNGTPISILTAELFITAFEHGLINVMNIRLPTSTAHNIQKAKISGDNSLLSFRVILAFIIADLFFCVDLKANGLKSPTIITNKSPIMAAKLYGNVL